MARNEFEKKWKCKSNENQTPATIFTTTTTSIIYVHNKWRKFIACFFCWRHIMNLEVLQFSSSMVIITNKWYTHTHIDFMAKNEPHDDHHNNHYQHDTIYLCMTTQLTLLLNQTCATYFFANWPLGPERNGIFDQNDRQTDDRWSLIVDRKIIESRLPRHTTINNCGQTKWFLLDFIIWSTQWTKLTKQN